MNASRAHGAERVLDIGCGWGQVLEYLVDRHNVKHALGLTLSRAQADFIEGLGDDRLHVREESLEKHQPEQLRLGFLRID